MAVDIEVRLFAAAAQAVGQRSVIIRLEGLSDLAHLSSALAEQYPGLQSLLPISRWAIDHQFAPLSAPVHPHQEIALIPPVSGG